MLFADGIDKNLLPKNILILNGRRKWETLVEFCLKYDINFKMFEVDAGDKFNVSKKLEPYTIFLPSEQYYNPQYYIETLDFVPEYILNCRDDFSGTTLEYKLSIHYDTKTQFDERALEFFTSKKEQDRVCKLMNIPTLDEGSINDKIIVKLDKGYGGCTGFKSVDKKDYIPKENEFIQRYIDYDYSIIQQILVDNNGDYHIYNHTIGKPGDGHIVGNNVPFMYQFPFVDFPKEEIDIIEDFYKKLKENITVKNRIVATEFSKERNGKLHFQEYNSRPFGQFEIGTYDWDIGKFNTLVDLFTNKVQDEIEYYQQVTTVYLDNVRNDKEFGWGTYDGLKIIRLPYSETIKTFNTIE
jgi:hypothetical protein